MAQAGTNIITLSDVRAIRGQEPRIKDVRLGEALGMAQPLNIRKVVEKNRVELEGFGLVHAVREPIKNGKGRTQHVTSYHLNEAQALLLCMFSRTEKAAEVRKEVITVFMAYRQGKMEKPVTVREYARAKPQPKPPSLPRMGPGTHLVSVNFKGDVTSIERLPPKVVWIDDDAWTGVFNAMRSVVPRKIVMR